MQPETETERKARAANEQFAREAAAIAERDDVDAKQVATTGVMLRLRPQMISGRVENGDAVDPQTGDLTEIPLMVLDLHIPGAMISVEFPLAGTPRVAAEMQRAFQVHKAQSETASPIVAASSADVQAAASKAKVAAQLRGDNNG